MAAAAERQPSAAAAAGSAPSAAVAVPVTSAQGHHHAGERGTAHYAFLQRVNAEIAQSHGHDRTLQLIEILEAAEAEPADDDSWRAAAPRFELDLRNVLALPTTPLTTTHSTFPADSTSSSSPPTTSTANALAKWWIQSRLRQLASSAAAGITATSTVAFFGLEAGKWAISSGMVQSYFASSAIKKLCDTALALPSSVIDPAIRLLRPVLGFASRHHVVELAALGTLGWLFVDSHRRYTETVRQHAAVHAAVAAARAQAEHDHVGGDDPMFFAPTHAVREDEEEGRVARRRLPAGGASPPRQPAMAAMSPELQRALWMHHATTAVVGAAFCAVAFCYVWKTIVLARQDVAAIDTNSNGTLAVRPSQVRLPNAAQEHLAVVFREPIDSVASERTVTITTVNNTDIVEGSRLPTASSRAASGWRGDELQLGSGSLAVVKGCHGVGLPKDTWRTALYIYDGARCGYVKLGPDGAAVNVSRLLPELSLSGDKCADLTSVAASSA